MPDQCAFRVNGKIRVKIYCSNMFLQLNPGFRGGEELWILQLSGDSPAID